MSLITITRNIGCNGTTISKRVAAELQLEFYDDARLEQEATRLGLRPQDMKSLDEKAPGLFDRLWGQKPEIYLDLLQSVVYEVAHRGQGIIMGHGSQMLIRDFGCALHVRIYASDSYRLNHLMKERGMSREAAENLIRKRDSERRGFIRYAFHMDWNDPSLYDVLINRDKLSTDSAVKLIVKAAQSREIKECSLTALDTMERMSLSRKVEAAIIKNDLSPHEFHIEVPEKGKALITGWTHSLEEKERVMEVVKGVPGVAEVKSDVAVIPMVGA
jgi:cytidylate kinase